ncbi:hypothetical protein evm_008224 [Chilo suppressalis]|nr:hypothetical protein evm_008224 [Chilo suppressalis]
MPQKYLGNYCRQREGQRHGHSLNEMNVSSACIDACNFRLDMENIMDRPECMNDFDKLMKCAADGSDHRGCCASWGVPRACLELCRGGSVSRSCALQHARRALACFRDSGARLPGPPRNLRAHQAPTPHAVLLSWDPPMKNPQTVYLYRVFWRAYGDKVPEKLDTSETSVVLTGLLDDKRYECVVKSANDLGTSSLSEAITFTTMGQETGAAAAPVTSAGSASAVGLAVACILVAAILLAAGLYYRHRKNLRLKAQGGVAFENPSYLREPNPDTIVNGTYGVAARDTTEPDRRHPGRAGGGPHALRRAETRPGWRRLQETEAIARGSAPIPAPLAATVVAAGGAALLSCSGPAREFIGSPPERQPTIISFSHTYSSRRKYK